MLDAFYDIEDMKESESKTEVKRRLVLVQLLSLLSDT